jgi:hypothetical protein
MKKLEKVVRNSDGSSRIPRGLDSNSLKVDALPALPSHCQPVSGVGSMIFH